MSTLDATTSPLVLRHDVDRVTTLSLNRPDKLNALTPSMFFELRAHLDVLAADPSVSCVVLAGAGRAFCAGLDLGGGSEHEPSVGPRFEAETIDALEALPMPTIARVQGHCYTGGLELALACDLLVAGESARIGDTHGQWGLVPIWGMTVRLPERVGRATAKQLMFTSRRITGAEAATIGLVDRCVADADLDEVITGLAAAIVGNSSGTNRIVKQLLSDHTERSRDEALQHERGLPHGTPDDAAERLAGAPGS